MREKKEGRRGGGGVWHAGKRTEPGGFWQRVRGVDFVKGFKRVEQAGFGPREERRKRWPSNVCVEGRGGGVFAIVVIKCAPHAP